MAQSFLKQLSNLFRGGPTPTSAYELWIPVQCKRCGEVIRARVDMRNELSPDYGEGGGRLTYVCRKVVVGKERCFQAIEITLRFDGKRNLLDKQVTGGSFVEE